MHRTVLFSRVLVSVPVSWCCLLSEPEAGSPRFDHHWSSLGKAGCKKMERATVKMRERQIKHPKRAHPHPQRQHFLSPELICIPAHPEFAKRDQVAHPSSVLFWHGQKTICWCSRGRREGKRQTMERRPPKPITRQPYTMRENSELM